MAYTWKKTRLRSPAPRSSRSVPATRTLSSIFTPATSAAQAGIATRSARTSSLEAIFDVPGPECGARAARRVALHVDGHRVHGDVGGRRFHVHRERRGIAAQALRA